MLQKTYYFGKKGLDFKLKHKNTLKSFLSRRLGDPNGRSVLYPAGGLPDNPKELSEI